MVREKLPSSFCFSVDWVSNPNLASLEFVQCPGTGYFVFVLGFGGGRLALWPFIRSSTFDESLAISNTHSPFRGCAISGT